jgi:phage-related protein
MADRADFVMQPTEVLDATKQLDELATRVEKTMQAEAANLAVTASASDEVSQRVASTLNEVHAEFTKSSDQGVNEIREVAATLRGHADNVVAVDQEFVV